MSISSVDDTKLSSASVNSQSEIPPELYAYWKFDNSHLFDGERWYDDVNNHEAHLMGTPTRVLPSSHLVGYAFEIMADDWIESGDPSSPYYSPMDYIDYARGFVIEAWVRLDDEYNHGERQTIVSGSTFHTGDYFTFGIETDDVGDGHTHYMYFEIPEYPTIYANALAGGEWMYDWLHYAMVLTFDLNSGHPVVNFYLNGYEWGIVYPDYSEFSHLFPILVDRILIGAFSSTLGAANQFLMGEIDEVAIYNEAPWYLQPWNLEHDPVFREHERLGWWEGRGYFETVNEMPFANDAAYVTDEDVILNSAPRLTEYVYDPDIYDGFYSEVFCEVSTKPSHGSLTFYPDGFFIYTPEPDWHGTDSFTYRAYNEIENGVRDYGNEATVTITVFPVNDAPVAGNDAYTTDEDIVLTVSAPGLLENDYDIEDDPLTAVLFDAPSHGSVLLGSDGSLEYIPDTNWFGIDSFTYQAYDGTDYSNIATVTITVNEAADSEPPVTTISLTGLEGEYGWYHSDVEVTLNAIDEDSDIASIGYSLDGVTWMPYTGPFILSTAGEVIIRYNSTDTAGNVEVTKTAVVKISKLTSSFVTGGGWIWDSEGEKGHFAFVVKYKNEALRGMALYLFREGGSQYIVKSTDWLGMAIDGNHVLLEARCTVLQYNYETEELSCLEDFYLRINFWDNGKGKTDVFQIQVFDESGELFHEAGFDPPGELQGGNLRIHVKASNKRCPLRYPRVKHTY
jgi:hypothetical protein